MKDRRYKIVKISNEIMTELLLPGARRRCNILGLPEDVEIIRSVYQEDYSQVVFLVTSPSFDHAPEIVPNLELTCTYYDRKCDICRCSDDRGMEATVNIMGQTLCASCYVNVAQSLPPHDRSKQPI